ncbi:MAG: tetratricopeptide repeat protein [Saprospiraceae bacterium]
MKKAFLFLTLIFLSSDIFSQRLDSLAVTKQVDSLIKISRELTANKNFEKAIEVNSFAEKLALEKLGKESVAYGSSCFNHGRVMDFVGDYPEAEKWYLESKTILHKVVGQEHPLYLKTLTNLGLLYYNIGQYLRAEPFFLESKTIREKVFGKEI